MAMVDGKQPHLSIIVLNVTVLLQVCCSTDEGTCPDGDGRWQIASIISVTGSQVTLDTGCNEVVTGFR